MTVDVSAKLFPNVATLIIQLISTGVLLFFFKKFLWIPVQNYFAKRADFIESQINEAKDMNAKAKAFVEESEAQSKKSALEYREIIAQAKQDANKVRDDIVAEANATAANKIAQAEKAIEAEKAQAKEELKEEMVDIAIDVASQVMQKDMNTKENKALVEDFVKKVN